MTVEARVNRGRLATTVEFSRSGAEVLIVDNLATASLVNPEREAGQWAETQLRRILSTGEQETIVVLGIASGFHLRALRILLAEKRATFTGEIVALDTCMHSVIFARSRVPNVTFIHIDSSCTIDQFVSKEDISPWLLQAFTLLKHKPTLSRTGESLRQLESWIVGRTPAAFLAQLKQRPEIAAGLNPTRMRKIAETPLVSIRDLAKMWDISSELKTDRRLFRVLEELVR